METDRRRHGIEHGVDAAGLLGASTPEREARSELKS
jgi:hypothetical protein